MKREYCLMLSVGCDRETTCNYLGWTAEELKNELLQDSEFKKQVMRAEATPEFNHMRNIHNASKEEKNWRASVWWLERRAPERYAKQAPNSVTASQLRKLLEELAEMLINEIQNPEDQRRLLNRLVEVADKIRNASYELADEKLFTEIREDPLGISCDVEEGQQGNE